MLFTIDPNEQCIFLNDYEFKDKECKMNHFIFFNFIEVIAQKLGLNRVTIKDTYNSQEKHALRSRGYKSQTLRHNQKKYDMYTLLEHKGNPAFKVDNVTQKVVNYYPVTYLMLNRINNIFGKYKVHFTIFGKEANTPIVSLVIDFSELTPKEEVAFFEEIKPMVEYCDKTSALLPSFI
jgi:hypothetical protein